MKNCKRNLTLALCLAIAVICAVSFVACDYSADSDVATEKGGYFVTIDINPSVELVVDANDNVLSAGGANRDAQVMLFQEDGIVGVNVNVAVENVAELAVRYGYLSQETSSVDIDVVTERTDGQAIAQNICARFVDSVANADCDISVNVTCDSLLTIAKELEALKAQYPDQKRIADMSESEYRLVKRVTEADSSIDLESALALSFDDLLEKVKSIHNGAVGKYGADYKRDVENAQFAYDSAKQTLNAGLYVAYFAAKAISTRNFDEKIAYAQRATYALEYLSAKSYELALSNCLACLDSFKSSPVYELTPQEMQDIATALGVDVATLEEHTRANESDGEYLVENNSLDAYINFLFRNADGQGKEQLAAAYDSVCEMLASHLDNKTVKDARAIVGQVFENTKNSLPTDVLLLSFVGGFIDVDDTILLFEPQDLDLSDRQALVNAIDELRAQADSAFEKMAITPQEYEELQNCAFAKDVKDKLNEAWNELNEKIEDAKSGAQQLLSEEKAQRDNERDWQKNPADRDDWNPSDKIDDERDDEEKDKDKSDLFDDDFFGFGGYDDNNFGGQDDFDGHDCNGFDGNDIQPPSPMP